MSVLSAMFLMWHPVHKGKTVWRPVGYVSMGGKTKRWCAFCEIHSYLQRWITKFLCREDYPGVTNNWEAKRLVLITEKRNRNNKRRNQNYQFLSDYSKHKPSGIHASITNSYFAQTTIPSSQKFQFYKNPPTHLP